MSEQPTHGAPVHHSPDKSGDLLSGNKKWYLVGALGAIAVLVFVFVRKSNANSASSSAGTPSSTLDPTTMAALQSALQTQASQGFMNGYGPPAYNIPPSTNTGTPSTSGTPSAGPILSLPNAGGQSWEDVQFPNQGALDAWTAWNQSFVNNNNAQAFRSQWNQELNSLGVTTQVGGQPLSGINPGSPNPYDRG